MPLLTLAALSTAYSLEPRVTAQRALSAWFVIVGFGIGIPLLLGRGTSIRRAMELLGILMGGAVVFSLYATYSDPTPGRMQAVGRTQGVFNNPNTLGMIATEAAFVLAYLWQRAGGSVRRHAFLLAMLAAVSMVVLSGSRASAVGLAAGLSVWIALNSQLRGGPRRSAAALVALVAVTLGAIYYFYPDFGSGLFRADAGARDYLWNRSWVLAQAAPYLGVGFGGSDSLYRTDALISRSARVYVSGAHNSYLKLLVELGFTGVVLAAYALAILLARAVRSIPHLPDPRVGAALLGGVAASLVIYIFEDGLFAFGSSGTVPFWLMFALLCSVSDAALNTWAPERRMGGCIQHPDTLRTPEQGSVPGSRV